MAAFNFMEPTIIARGPQILIVQCDEWERYYEDARRAIEAAAGDLLLAFEHVGSTAVPGLAGKPVLDILAGTASLDNGPAIAARLQPLGFMQIPFMTPDRLFFLKRMIEVAEGVDLKHPGFNIHVVPMDRFHQDEQLVFRDYLRGHPELAAQYAQLKCDLAGRIKSYKEYMPAKAEFVQRILASARAPSG